MKNTLYSTKIVKSKLRKNILFLYKIKLNFMKTHINLKLFYSSDFFESVNKYVLDVFECMAYDIKIKKQLLESLKHIKGLTEKQCDLIFEISKEFEKYEDLVTKKIRNIINLIKAYNSGYNFFYSENYNDEIILSKSNIKDKLVKIGF